jgi:hypothetical protein
MRPISKHGTAALRERVHYLSREEKQKSLLG